MGQAVAEFSQSSKDLRVAGIWSRDENLSDLLDDSDILIDFSLPQATDIVLNAALATAKPWP